MRENVNGAFFAMAMANGLNAAIINPGSDGMMRVYHSFRALMGLDDRCGDYIRVYAEEAAKKKAAGHVNGTANLVGTEDKAGTVFVNGAAKTTHIHSALQAQWPAPRHRHSPLPYYPVPD